MVETTDERTSAELAKLLHLPCSFNLMERLERMSKRNEMERAKSFVPLAVPEY